MQGDRPSLTPTTLPLQQDNPAARGTGPLISRGSPIPTFTFGSPASSASSPQALNGVATTAQDRQAQVAAENAPIRIPYGRVAMGAQIADVLFYNGNLVIIAVWGQGPVNLIETVYLDEAAPAASVTIVNHDGTQTVPDATLVAAYAAQSPPITYTDILPNIAYSVITLPPNVTTGFPRVGAIVQGLKIWDPRSSTFVYSDNPALVIGDLQTNTTYGAGGQVDWASVTTVANADDALVAGSEKRRTIGLLMDTPQDLDQWMEALRAYAGCFLARTGNLLTLSVDRPTSSSFTFSEALGTCRVKNVRRRSKRDVPTVSAVRYTDTTAYPWRDTTVYAYAPGVLAGTVPWKLREVAMPGIQRSTQALREAVEQLNKLTINDLTLDIEGQDESLSVTVGDVVTVSANLGITSRLVRVLAVATPMLGRPVFACENYDPAVYSDSIVTTASIVDTALPNPNVLSAPSGLTVTENVYLEQVNGSALSGGLIYQSRFDCTWTPPTLAYPISYRVEVWDGATKIRDELTSNTTYSSPAVQQGKTYTVNVFSRNSLGVESAAATTAKAALGKLLIPGPVPAITEGRELGGTVRLAWTAAVDIDVMRYEWRYTPNQTAGGSWAAATFIDRIDGLRAQFGGLPVGTHRFYVRAIDSVGQYSSADCTVDVTITIDPNAFIQEHEFTSPTLTNMVEIPMIEGVWKRRWATRVATDAFTAVEPNAFNSGGAAAVISYHASATSKWQGESWDLGQLTTGDWTLSAPETNVTGAATFAIETSPDGSTWTSQPGISFRGAARFVRPVIQSLTTGTMIVTAPVKISLASLVKTEAGQVTTLASGGKSVLLTGKYSGYQDLQATAVNTATARYIVVDRILLHAQGGFMVAYTETAIAGATPYRGGLDYGIFSTGRTILGDDYLEYDVYVDPSSPAVAALAGVLSISSAGTNVPASLADNASNSIVSDFSADWLGTLGSFTAPVGGAQDLLDKWNVTGNQRSWQFVFIDGGTLRIAWDPLGTAAGAGANALVLESSSVTVVSAGLSAGTPLGLRVESKMNNGAGGYQVQFFYSTDGGASWTQLGATKTGAAISNGIFDSTSPVTIGGINGSAAALPLSSGSACDRAKLYAGVAGAKVLKADLNPTTATVTGQATLADGVSGTWNIGADSMLTLAEAAGGFYVGTSTLNTNAINDADGYNSRVPTAAFDALARGQWKARKVALGSLVGLSATVWRISCHTSAGGAHKVLYRNVRVTNGAGVDRLVLWSAGEATNPSLDAAGSQTNVRVGPANSFLLYAFNDAGAQQAQDAQYSIRAY